MAKWVWQPYSRNTAFSIVSTFALRGTGWGGTQTRWLEVQRTPVSWDSLTFSPDQQVQVHVCSSCLEHFVCDECRNVHLRGREERRRGDGGDGGEEGRGGREGGEGGEEGREGRRGGREGGEGGEEGNKYAELKDGEVARHLLSCHLSRSLEESCSRVSNDNTNFILK